MKPCAVLLAVVLLIFAMDSHGATNAVGSIPKKVILPARDRAAVPRALATSKQGVVFPPLRHEVWGRTYRGDGYVYGPTFRAGGVTVVDIDVDGDNDFVVPGDNTNDFAPQLFRNLGASGAFYPGGLKDLTLQNTDYGVYLSLSLDFADVNGDGLPDLLAAVNDWMSCRQRVAWYRNVGPVDMPEFEFVEYVYTSGQVGLPGMWVDWADINNDRKLDLFFVEAFLDEPSRHHRVFGILNEGTRSDPIWQADTAEEICGLSQLLPSRIEYKSAKKDGPNAAAWFPPSQTGAPAKSVAAKASYGQGISDFEVADWNADGDLDFLYYDVCEGVHWIRNLGTPEVPEWDAAVASAGLPLYDHREDGMTFTEGTFSIRPNPDPVGAVTEWLDEFYISVDGWLMTWRYFMASLEKSGHPVDKDYIDFSPYRLIQENSVAYAAGQGSAAFWDYDGDGDLDMFRLGVGVGSQALLLLFPNIGVPYAPAWGEYAAIDAVALAVGAAGNNYRQDMFTFADHDLASGADLFVQNQDGTVDLYWAYQATEEGALPNFYLLPGDESAGGNENFGDVVLDGETGVEPRGLALANFDVDDPNDDDWLELIAAYASDQGGRIMYYDPKYEDFRMDISYLFSDGEGGLISPNDIESLSTADLDRDGRPDLVVALGAGGTYQDCTLLYYRNRYAEDFYGPGLFAFDYIGPVEKPSSTDPYYGRLVSFVDIDADSDDDLFLGHQYYREGDSLPWHYLRFYRNTEDTGFGFWRTRVVTGQSWYLVLENELPFYTWVVNASGGELNNPSAGAYSAGDVSGVVDIIDSSNGYRVYIDVLPEVTAADSKAVLVVGSDSSDPLYNTFVDLASYAYWVLRNEGLPAEAVRLYAATQFDADEDGTMDVEDAPNEAALEQSITDWAVGTDRLLVYLVDHGQRERFRLNATEYLDASTYAAWVNTLQPGGVGPQVTTIIDTCEAGTFIDDLGLSVKELKADAQRITIASSGIGPIEGLAMFDAVQDISFSLSFWRAIFDGETYGQAFDTAKVAVEAMNVLQAPQIDDDGDGIPNEANDGLLANLARPGAEFAVSLPGVFIGDVAPNQAIASNSATLWLSDVVTPFPVDQAGALVIPPNFQRPSPTGDDEQPVTGMDWVDFAYNADLERWETSYSGFVVGGLYTILYYIDAGGKYNASPRIGFVDRIDAPDAWETDDAAHQARWIPANSVQGHNFHAENDQDWIRFASPTANAATIAVMPAGHMCQPAVALYKQSALDSNPGAAPVRQISAEGPGEEVIFEASFVRSEQYLLRIMNNDPLVYGAGTSYLVIVAVGTGGVLPNTLVVSAFDSVTSDPVAGASVTFDHTITSQTTSDGVVQFICPDYASYNVSASKTGYNECSQDVNVNHQIESVSISLVPESGEGEGEGEGPTQCAVVQGRYPGGPFGHLNGDVILFAALTLLLLGPKRRRVRTRS